MICHERPAKHSLARSLVDDILTLFGVTHARNSMPSNVNVQRATRPAVPLTLPPATTPNPRVPAVGLNAIDQLDLASPLHVAVD